jgi:hypothetical protein
MKKLALITLLIGCSVAAFASTPDEKNKKNALKSASDDGEKNYTASTHIINVGVGVGGRLYHTLYKVAGFDYRRTPAFSLSYEQPWQKKLGPGYLGVGAYFAYQHERLNYRYDYYGLSNYYYNHSWNYYMIAARATYHWDVLNLKNADVYAGALLGMRFQTSIYDTNDPNSIDPYAYAKGSLFPTYTVFAGARWYFVKHIAVFGEAGYGISYLTGGLSFKF